MSTTTLTAIAPIIGVLDGKGHPDPAVRQAWLEERRGGATATDVRDWGNSSDRRKILAEKTTGEQDDMSAIRVRGSEFTLGDYAEHGNRREPVIAEWVRGRFGIEPCSNVYHHGENFRHMASPDGITLDPFTRELVYGTLDTVLAEIKTSKNDLHPGELDAARNLVRILEGSKFDTSGYYVQMQWQMYVMQAQKTLFVWEQHDNVIDPETGTFTPMGPPQWAWVHRDQALIDVLVEKRAPEMLAAIDAARIALKATDLPPASDFPSEDAVLVADVLKARDEESVAKKAKEVPWAALNEKYVGEGKPDMTVDLGFATFTVSTTKPLPGRSVAVVTDWDAVRAGLTEAQRKKYDALVEKHTKEVVTETPAAAPKQSITITPKKAKP